MVGSTQTTQESPMKPPRNPQEIFKKRFKSPQERLILEFCVEEKSLKEIVDYFGYKDVKNFRKNYIKPLLETGRIKMTIPNQPKNRNQKYITNYIKK